MRCRQCSLALFSLPLCSLLVRLLDAVETSTSLVASMWLNLMLGWTVTNHVSWKAFMQSQCWAGSIPVKYCKSVSYHTLNLQLTLPFALCALVSNSRGHPASFQSSIISRSISGLTTTFQNSVLNTDLSALELQRTESCSVSIVQVHTCKHRCEAGLTRTKRLANLQLVTSAQEPAKS